jgi:FlaA1/EpsC-like NDP-sugar epimerase
MMGASKRIMEMYLLRNSDHINVSTARFANVAFSNGSLLHSFGRRIEKRQPLVAPCDVKRYFVTGQEAGELCLMSCILGWNRDIFFPKLDENIHLTRLSDILERYLNAIGYEPYYCESEDEARSMAKDISLGKKVWPCLLTSSDTTGEKFVEEFFTEHETLDLVRFAGLGIIKNDATCEETLIDLFEKTISQLKKRGNWSKDEIVSLFCRVVPGFNHIEKGKSLDGKM